MIGLAPAHTSEIAGREVALDYGNVEREYAALRSGAMLVDRSHRGRMRFRGEKSREILNGLLTNDIQSLSQGEGCYACALTAKGKIIADLFAHVTGDSVLVDISPRAHVGFRDMIRKYVNPRLSAYSDVTRDLAQVGLFGTASRRMLASALGIDEAGLESVRPNGHIEVDSALVVKSPALGLQGFDIMTSVDRLEEIWASLVRAGATPAGMLAWDIARIEAGRPELGVDMDENTLVQEANMDDLHAISYTKGCYTGQETVARVHFRGHVNRHLRALRHAHESGVPTGAELVDAGGKLVGDVRSTASSPRLGQIAMAMVRHEVEMPASLHARWENGAQSAEVEVYELPFPL
jgi:tRNA-modifying protein YgfZ